MIVIYQYKCVGYNNYHTARQCTHRVGDVSHKQRSLSPSASEIVYHERRIKVDTTLLRSTAHTCQCAVGHTLWRHIELGLCCGGYPSSRVGGKTGGSKGVSQATRVRELSRRTAPQLLSETTRVCQHRSMVTSIDLLHPSHNETNARLSA